MPELSLVLKNDSCVPLLAHPHPGVQSKQGLDEASEGESICLLLGHLDTALLLLDPALQEIPWGAYLIPIDAFTELQAKVMDTQQKVKLADLQIEQLTKTKKHAHLTDTEVMMLVDETRMYEGVGRMFILQPKGVIHNQLLEKQRIAEEKIKELEQKKSYLERSVKEAEDNIREMLMARRAQ
uniref:Prefoldin subunit 1 n=1 Tax=Serinus canaria TaxID=9135 RepID=A0A8C9N3W0_SERCA